MKKVLLIIPMAFLFFKTMHGVLSKSPFRSVEKEKISDKTTQYSLYQGNIKVFFLVTIKGREITKNFFARARIREKNKEDSVTKLNDENVQVAQMKKILFEYLQKDLNKK